MKTAEIRRRFLNYFERQNHRIVTGSSLVPGNDPTLLFTNAGMVQFKDVFLGNDKRDYSRAVTTQRCVRAGGKHNDLENVGYTARHHTFFEMLGNFSFGDYFKRDAIRFAWQFLTEELGLPKEKLWVTVYKDDDEAADIWVNEIGVDPDRLSRLGEKDNFWMMGDTGPCGPCSEIFYDHGEDVPGGPPGSPDDDLDRYIEIWNLVFMQYETLEDGTRVSLPNPSIDTGMGLERLAAVLQDVHSNYEIDLFQSLIAETMSVTGCSDAGNQSLRVIADHIRSTSFLIADSVVPSNEGRGYVLRRIIRRAIRHGYKLGCDEPFFHKLVDKLVTEMGDAYPELAEQAGYIKKVLLLEEEQFARTLEHGMSILEQGIASLAADEIPGELAFKLYDTYGFPIDLTADIARERGLSVDFESFDVEMEKQRDRAKGASKFKMDKDFDLGLSGHTQFLGYEVLEAQGKVLKIFASNQDVDILGVGQTGMVVLDETPFYAESGGQIGDRGTLFNDTCSLKVTDCRKIQGHHVHYIEVEQGRLTLGDSVTANVISQEREDAARHHSATHLMHAALRQILGTHVAQKGSLVSFDKLRFDFSHLEPVTIHELQEIERIVNAQIAANTAVTTEVMEVEAAKAAGAMALFGEKYDDQVRVLTMGTDGFSKELCGGTHVKNTGDIGLFRIVAETGIAAGVRRIEAVVGRYALQRLHEQDGLITELQAALKSSPEQLVDRASQLTRQLRQAEKTIEQLKAKLAGSAAEDLADQAIDLGTAKLLVAELEGADPKALRSAIDRMKDKLQSAIVVLAVVVDDKVQLAVGVTKDLSKDIKAGDIIKEVAALMDARGGGKPDMAMAGGGSPEKLGAALEQVEAIVRNRLP